MRDTQVISVSKNWFSVLETGLQTPPPNFILETIFYELLLKTSFFIKLNKSKQTLNQEATY
jgi:hypothetical protein